MHVFVLVPSVDALLSWLLSLASCSCFLAVEQGYRVPESLQATNDIAAAVSHAEVILMVIPTPFVAATMSSIRQQFRADQVESAPVPSVLHT
jgi:formylmethanofuran dehydrogenase subunit B